MKVRIKTAKITVTTALLVLALVWLAHVSGSRASTQELSAADRMLAIEEIHQLKARYIRCMDMKDWVCWEDVLAPDFHFKGSTVEWHSAKEMVQSTHLSGLFDRVKTVSHVYTPEIEILSPSTAKGTWGADFFHYWPAGTGTTQGRELVMRGQWNHSDAYYHDSYVKIGARWFIQSEEVESIRETGGRLEN